VPALRSSWLVMHVSVIMVSYAALLVARCFFPGVLSPIATRPCNCAKQLDRQRGFRQAKRGHQRGDLQLSSWRSHQRRQLDSLSYRTEPPLAFCCFRLGW